MSLMKRFPIDTIKIDRSFMQDLPQGTEDKGIAEAIIGMGKALGLTVIAEGVETSDQELFVRKHACDELLGFLFSKAVSSEDLAGFAAPKPLSNRCGDATAGADGLSLCARRPKECQALASN